ARGRATSGWRLGRRRHDRGHPQHVAASSSASRGDGGLSQVAAPGGGSAAAAKEVGTPTADLKSGSLATPTQVLRVRPIFRRRARCYRANREAGGPPIHEC